MLIVYQDFKLFHWLFYLIRNIGFFFILGIFYWGWSSNLPKLFGALIASLVSKKYSVGAQIRGGGGFPKMWEEPKFNPFFL